MPSALRTLKTWASDDSAKEVAMPSRATTHIQNRAPGAQSHRERDPRDIAGSHASSQPDDEGLEARQAAALVARARNQMNRPGEQAHLDAARADRQVQAGAEQDPDEDLPGDELLECGQVLREVGSRQNGQRSGHAGLHRSGVGAPDSTGRSPRRRGASASGNSGYAVRKLI